MGPVRHRRRSGADAHTGVLEVGPGIGCLTEQLAQRGGKPVTTYVPFRNGLFLSAAASVALSKNCSVIYYGAHHDDAAGNAYPDCSEDFVNAMNHSIVLGSGGDVRIELRSCVGTRRRSLPKVCGCRFLSADVELLRGR